MHLQQTIEKLLNNAEEAAVYLAALRIGEATVTEIAKEAKIPRTSCYHILETLTKRGLISSYPKQKRKHYIAENPQKLLMTLKEHEAALREIMPQLQALDSATGAKPVVRFYEGADGIRQIFQDILSRKKEILAITSLDDMMRSLENEFGEFVSQRKKQFLRVRLLTNKTEAALAFAKKDAEEFRHTHFLPEGDARAKTANFIYGNRIAIISPNANPPTGLIIEDQNIAETQQLLFETLWQYAKEN